MCTVLRREYIFIVSRKQRVRIYYYHYTPAPLVRTIYVRFMTMCII